MKQFFVNALVVAALSISGGGLAQAEDSAPVGSEMKDGHKACRAEVEKLCPGLKPGQDMHKCVEEHVKELSAACQEHHKQMQARHEKRQEVRAEVKEACSADQEKLCKGLEPGKGLFKCMHEKESELSEGCKAAMSEFKEQKPKHGKRGHPNKKSETAVSTPAGE